MVAIAGIASITELRQLVGSGWIADIETSQEILHESCDPVEDVLCRDPGVEAMAHGAVYELNAAGLLKPFLDDARF